MPESDRQAIIPLPVILVLMLKTCCLTRPRLARAAVLAVVAAVLQVATAVTAGDRMEVESAT